jgi:hypothetical protein
MDEDVLKGVDASAWGRGSFSVALDAAMGPKPPPSPRAPQPKPKAKPKAKPTPKANSKKSGACGSASGSECQLDLVKMRLRHLEALGQPPPCQRQPLPAIENEDEDEAEDGAEAEPEEPTLRTMVLAQGDAQTGRTILPPESVADDLAISASMVGSSHMIHPEAKLFLAKPNKTYPTEKNEVEAASESDSSSSDSDGDSDSSNSSDSDSSNSSSNDKAINKGSRRKPINETMFKHKAPSDIVDTQSVLETHGLELRGNDATNLHYTKGPENQVGRVTVVFDGSWKVMCSKHSHAKCYLFVPFKHGRTPEEALDICLKCLIDGQGLSNEAHKKLGRETKKSMGLRVRSKLSKK